MKQFLDNYVSRNSFIDTFVQKKEFIYRHTFVQKNSLLTHGQNAESRAITQYLAHTYADKGTPLVTSDPKKMAILSIWTEVEGQRFDPQASKLVYEIVLKHMLGQTIDEAIVAQYEGKLAEVLDVYEARLAQSKYLGGDSFTLADLHHLPVINYLMGSKIKSLFDERPHVSAWCADILGRPSWKKVVELMKH